MWGFVSLILSVYFGIEILDSEDVRFFLVLNEYLLVRNCINESWCF